LRNYSGGGEVVGSPAVQWTLSLVFAVTAGYYVYRPAARRVGGWKAALDDALHVLMSVAMVAMVWPWGMAVPVMLYIVTFTAAMLWFVARALFTTSTLNPIGHHDSCGQAWYHAAMMAAMIWMGLAMSVAMTGVPSGKATTGAAAAQMPGMDMGAGPASAGAPSPPPLWIYVPSVALAIGFGVAAVWFVVAQLRDRRVSALSGAASGLMAAGMAFALLGMA
jgi:hypothetical protein